MSSVIEVKPLTRVEGHGIVRVYRDGHRVERVELSLIEPPRLFEALLIGKHYSEVPDIICRICSLCSTIHRVTSLMAIEKALDISVPEDARLYRELIVLGGHIQSHALHLFCLTLPDYYDVKGFPDLGRLAPELLQLGLKIKSVGNSIQETIGGRLIHPVNIRIGGMGQPLDHGELSRLKDGLESILEGTLRTAELFASFKRSLPPLSPTVFLATQDGQFPLFGQTIVATNGSSVSGSDYRSILRETVSSHSHGKISRCADTSVTVSALARLTVGMALTPLATTIYRREKTMLDEGEMWRNDLAQAVELIFAVEAAIETINHLVLVEPQPSFVPVHHRRCEGTAVTEAPRGTLIHSYRFDSRGYCDGADIITPTAINQASMEEALLTVARCLEGADDPELKRGLEMLMRAYDPCISCAVHVIAL